MIGVIIFFIFVIFYPILFSIIGYSICKSNPWVSSNWPDWNGSSSKKLFNVELFSFIVTLMFIIVIYVFGRKYITNQY